MDTYDTQQFTSQRDAAGGVCGLWFCGGGLIMFVLENSAT